jgi:hypothetical protein
MQRVRRVLGLASIVGLSAVALVASGGAGGAPSAVRTSAGGTVDLTGEWRGNDGSTYYIRHDKRTIWWVGFNGRGDSPSLGLGYSHVFRGTISGSTISGDWVDVPRGERPWRRGRLTLTITGGDSLRKTSRGGLLTKSWNKES